MLGQPEKANSLAYFGSRAKFYDINPKSFLVKSILVESTYGKVHRHTTQIGFYKTLANLQASSAVSRSQYITRELLLKGKAQYSCIN
jgi:hypothetical protein